MNSKHIEKKEVFVPHQTCLVSGTKAPDFIGLNQYGEEISLKTYFGKKLILFFYPKDNTPTCTTESCNLENNNALLKKLGFEILGVSADSVKSHKKFSDKYKLNYNLLADVDMNAIRAYDVWGKKKFMGLTFTGIIRTTFVINEEGYIKHVITNVKSKEHSKQIMDLEGI